MISVSIKSDQTQLLRDILAAIPGAVTRAGTRVVNSTATGLRHEAAKWVGLEYAIAKKEILSRLKVDRAKGGVLQADVVGADNKGLQLLIFTSKKYQKGSSTQRGPGGSYTPAIGVPVQIKKSGGPAPRPGVFTQTMKNGHVGLFKRMESGNRIKEQYLATPLNILQQPQYSSKVDEYVEKKLPVELARQIDRELANA